MILIIVNYNVDIVLFLIWWKIKILKFNNIILLLNGKDYYLVNNIVDMIHHNI
jgi:hypothetical protein